MLGRKRYLIEDSTHSEARPETVIGMVRDPATWPRWQPEIETTSGPTPLDAGDDVTGLASMMGFRVEGRSKTLDASETELVEHAIVGVGMRITYRVEATDSGSRIVRTLDATLPGGLLGTPIAWVLRWRLKRMQKEVLAALAAQASVGA